MKIENSEYPVRRARLYELFKRRKFAFVHVPKTGGISVSDELASRMSSEHATALELRDDLTEAVWKELFTFGFTRNPEERFISAFWYLKSGRGNVNDNYWANNNLNEILTAEMFIQRAVNDKEIMEWVHFKPQWHFLCDEEKNIIVNFVGKYENIEDDFLTIAKNINSIKRQLKKINVTPSYSEKFSEWDVESQKKLYNLYSEDYAIFGYKKYKERAL